MVRKKQTDGQSVYGTGPKDGLIESHILSMLVDNESGVLARVSGLFSGRGYNIESLTVAVTDEANNLARITVVCSGTALIIEQIKNQIDRLVPVHRVTDLTLEGDHVERELALVKVHGDGAKRLEILQTADIFRARVVDTTANSFVFEVTGSSAKVEAFIKLMRGLGMVDLSRTGVAAMSRGTKAI